MRALSCTFPAVTIEMQGAREPSLPLKVAFVLSMDSIGPVSLVPTKLEVSAAVGEAEKNCSGQTEVYWHHEGVQGPSVDVLRRSTLQLALPRRLSSTMHEIILTGELSSKSHRRHGHRLR